MAQRRPIPAAAPQRPLLLAPLLLLILLQAAAVVRAFVGPSPSTAARRPASASAAAAAAAAQRRQRVPPLRMSLRQDPVAELSSFLKEQAGVESVPGDVSALLQLLHYRGEEPVSPAAGKELGLHPLVVPVAKAADGDYTCLLRWPTPQEGAPIPVVKARSGGLHGLRLVAQSTLELAHRLAAEEDHTQGKEADWAASLVNQHLPEEKRYARGAVEKVGYGLERFLFLKVGPFPDVYEFLTEFHLGKGDQQSALVTCEKAYDTFKGWGQPYMQYCKLLQHMAGRELEMRDAALAALRTPLWTVALEPADLDLVLEAAKSSRDKAREKFWKLYQDERLQEIKQGKRPEQVALDRAAFLMDAALLGADGMASWSDVREPLADLYEEARLTELAKFVRGA